MPLSPPASRRHIHTRKVTCQGFLRDDGLWDIEGHITDEKTYGFSNAHRGGIEAGEPIHDMWLRITIDDRLEIQDAEASTEAGPYRTCGDITPAYKVLVGLTIRPGFTKAVRNRLGGVHGCTHVTELLGPMATTAYQTAFASREQKHGPAKPRHKLTRPPGHLNTCHALATDGEVVREQYPQFFTGDREAV